MELNKDNIKKIMGIIVSSLVIFWGLNHLSLVHGIFKAFLGIISPFVMGLCFAFLINILLIRVEKIWEGTVGKRAGRIGKRLQRPVCLTLSLLLIIGVIFIILFMVIPELQRNILIIGDKLPQFAKTAADWWNGLAETAKKYSIVFPEADLNGNEIGKTVSDFLSKKGGLFLNKTMDITISIVTVIVNMVLGIVFAVYVLAQKETLSGQVKKLLSFLLPSKKVKRILELASMTNQIFTNFVAGQLTESVIIGVLCFIGMLILRIPYAAVISVLIGFTALIPVFGALFGTVAGAFLILAENPWKALIFVIFLIILQQVEGNVIYPKVVGKSVGLPGIWVLTAVTVGGSTFGVLGMLLGVPVCSVIYCLVKQAVNRSSRGSS